MGKIFVATLGFDEKFIIGGLVRHNISRGDRVYLLTVEPVEEKTRVAFNRVEEFIKNYVKGVKIELVAFKLTNFVDLTIDIMDFLNSIAKCDKKVYVNLSGGMRALILSLYNALFFLSRKFTTNHIRVQVDVELENRSGVFNLKPGLLNLIAFYSSITANDLKFLNAIGEESSLKELVNKMGLQPSTVSKKINKLEKLGLVEVINKKPLKVRVAECAKFLKFIV